MPPSMPPAWLDRNTGLPSLANLSGFIRISSALSSPLIAAVANPAPISTPLTALMPITARTVDLVRAHLNERGAHGEAGHDLARDGAGGNARGGFARRGAPTATIIVNAVFDVVSVAGVAGPVFVLDLGIVLRALINVLDQQHNRRTGGHLLAVLAGEHAGHDLYRVGLLALGGEPRLAGPALVEMLLDILDGERNPRRTAVDHAADRRPVTFAEAGEPEKMAERIERHGSFVPRSLAAVKYCIIAQDLVRKPVPTFRDHALCVSRHPIVLKHIHDALRDIDQRGGV